MGPVPLTGPFKTNYCSKFILLFIFQRVRGQAVSVICVFAKTLSLLYFFYLFHEGYKDYEDHTSFDHGNLLEAILQCCR